MRQRKTLNVIFLDLIKVKSLIDKPIEELTPAERWGMFFSYADDKKYREYIRKISEMEKGIMAADNTVQYMSEEDANWARQNSYFIATRDYNTRMENAEKRGMERGLEKGMKQGLQQGLQRGEQTAKVETVKNMLNMKLFSVEQIAQADIATKGYTVFNLRFATKRMSGKTSDEQVWQYVHIAVPTNNASLSTIKSILEKPVLPNTPAEVQAMIDETLTEGNYLQQGEGNNAFKTKGENDLLYEPLSNP